MKRTFLAILISLFICPVVVLLIRPDKWLPPDSPVLGAIAGVITWSVVYSIVSYLLHNHKNP